MCPFIYQRRCKNRTWTNLFVDGICRPKDSLSPSQLVCPIGKVLCPDLTCQDNYYNCLLSEELPIAKVRCIDQTIATGNKYCPSTITCSNPQQVVCPDGQCVDNEIFCNDNKECPKNYPYY